MYALFYILFVAGGLERFTLYVIIISATLGSGAIFLIAVSVIYRQKFEGEVKKKDI